MQKPVSITSDEWNDNAQKLLYKLIVGQPQVVEKILPYIRVYRGGLNWTDRPAGNFLLLGPTGVGKTRTVEALATLIHRNYKNVLKIDCGEYQMDHEVAKLIGAPPGYLGHRETTAVLSAKALASVRSEHSNLALVLFDEIEKAAPSMNRLLLGILDKGTLHLGDNTGVEFNDSMIFMTSNVGASAMQKLIRNDFGFASDATKLSAGELRTKFQSIGDEALRRKFSTEFINRIDEKIVFGVLEENHYKEILEWQFLRIQSHVSTRLGAAAPVITYTPAARELLLRQGISQEYGARQLNRVLYRQVMVKIAALLETSAPSGLGIIVDVIEGTPGETTAYRGETLTEYATETGKK